MTALRTFNALARPKALHGAGLPIFEMVGRPDGAFHLRSGNGLMRAADGVYNFVRIQGGLRNQTPLYVSARAGHAALAQGQPVLYAGTLSVRQGQLAWWSNYSGTYQPSPHFRTQARLPSDKFMPWQELQMGGVGLQRGMLSDHRREAAPGRPQPEEPRPKPETGKKPAPGRCEERPASSSSRITPSATPQPARR